MTSRLARRASQVIALFLSKNPLCKRAALSSPHSPPHSLLPPSRRRRNSASGSASTISPCAQWAGRPRSCSTTPRSSSATHFSSATWKVTSRSKTPRFARCAKKRTTSVSRSTPAAGASAPRACAFAKHGARRRSTCGSASAWQRRSARLSIAWCSARWRIARRRVASAHASPTR